MNSLSIRTKITIWFIAILVVLLTINFAVFFSIGERVARDTAKDDLYEVVQRNLGEVRYIAGNRPDGKGKEETSYIVPYGSGYMEVDDFLDMMSGVASGLYSSDGELLYGTDLIPKETEDLKFVEGEIGSVKSGKDTFYILDEPIEVEGHEDVWIRGMIDRAQDRDQVYRMYKGYVTILPLMIIIAALVGYIVAHRALSPLDNVAEEIGKINRQADLSNRIEEDSSDYEIRIIVEALNHMLERLENSYVMTRRFTANVSHDLRTPTAIIAAQTELALEEEMSDELRDAFESIQKQGTRMSEILDALLTYTRLENASTIYELEDTNLSEAVSDTCRSFRVMQNDEMILEEDIEEDVWIKGNAALIHGMLENLLSNAFRYSDSNGHIAVRLESDGDKARITVSDNGIGIPEEEQDKIFDWMYQVDGGSSRGGSGFGLFIVKSIVQLHEGEIHLDSKVGEGSTFTVEFKKVNTATSV